MPLQDNPSHTTPLGLYCHVPFCASTCDFCAFYQEKPRRADLDRYLEGMEREFQALPGDRPVETVFWGGGTPGLLPARDLERLGRALLKRLPAPPVEWTIEMAPSTVKADKLATLKALGVTRISMGVQSFDPTLLESLGRLHNPSQIYTAWERIQAAGFVHTNLDLIFAIPGQTLEAWDRDLTAAMALGPDHISTYCLTFEEDTKLWLKLSKGQIKRDEALEVQLHEHAWQRLEEGGFAQYEISNFARPGGACLHNIRTWEMAEWLGCGPSAAAQYQGRRRQRPSDLSDWLAELADESAAAPGESIDDTMLATDRLVFGLRMNAGVDLAELETRFPGCHVETLWGELLTRLEGEGYLERSGTRIRLTHTGRLVCDAIGSALLDVPAEA